MTKLVVLFYYIRIISINLSHSFIPSFAIFTRLMRLRQVVNFGAHVRLCKIKAIFRLTTIVYLMFTYEKKPFSFQTISKPSGMFR